jgi:hypothetical protein
MPSLKGPIIGMLVAPVLTWLAYSTAVSLQAGEEIKTTGRRAGLKALFVAVAETLGPTGSLVVGGIITAAMVAWLVYALGQRKKARAAPTG